ncbi:glycosyltransferase family 4 protein [Halomicronema sp. CCY15110]|uniref:glycosyltransferase family 4 protein n=1 Tax=Halomicronema sp. CCY15110 TaxID=2767773 RepID=UPI0019508ECF|nr:glycosyltransferase family 4 protein [Halomicronema sp. CCY15110]
MFLNSLKSKVRSQFPQLAGYFKKARSKSWPRNSVVYYTGNRKDGLTPENLKQGTSGTDSAVIYLSREWAKAGQQVTVFSNCDGLEGDYDGVRYINHYKFNPYDTFDTLIILSHPYLLPDSVSAKKLCWDWHDVLGSDRVYPPAKIARFDQIFAKSKFQRDLLPDIPDAKFTIATNGINQAIFNGEPVEKQPFKIIYSSRYYRGLESMLKYGWPLIVDRIPQAELHIYHGWSRRELQSKYDDWRDEMALLFQQPGVVEHGRVSQEKLIAEKATASIHYYACTYPEIDCISVRESAAVGCVPVTTDFAAFQEKSYCVKVAGEPEAQETQEKIAHRIIELLENPDELSILSERFRELVKRETWHEVSKVWLQYFDED